MATLRRQKDEKGQFAVNLPLVELDAPFFWRAGVLEDPIWAMFLRRVPSRLTLVLGFILFSSGQLQLGGPGDESMVNMVD